MKSFQYKAKAEDGKMVEGIIDTDHFEEATDEIKKRGLELLSLEELRNSLSPFIFEATDPQGEVVQGSIQARDEEAVKEKLFKEFGYAVQDVHEKIPTPSEKDDHIIFSEKPVQKKVFLDSSYISEEKLQNIHSQIQEILEKSSSIISEKTKNVLLHLDGKIDLLRSYATRRHWWLFQWDVRKTIKKARKEIQRFHDDQLKAYDQNLHSGGEISYSELNPIMAKKRFSLQMPEKIQQFFQRLRVFDQPDDRKEAEVLIKQQYESIWIELYKFTGVLFAFYLCFFFTGYYLKRNFGDDQLFVRIFDTLLFKQIIMILFSLVTMMGIRHYFLSARLRSDALLIFGFVAIVFFVS